MEVEQECGANLMLTSGVAPVSVMELQKPASIMSKNDIKAWSIGREGATPPGGVMWLAERLHRACGNGSVEQVKVLLDKGANARGINGAFADPYLAALRGRHDECALLVVKAMIKSISEKEKHTIVKNFTSSASRWSSVLEARDMCTPEVGDQELMKDALADFNMVLVLDSSRHGVSPSVEAWTGLSAALSKENCSMSGSLKMSCLEEWVQDHANTLPGGANGTRLLFEEAIRSSNERLLGTLLDSGLALEKDWVIKERGFDPKANRWSKQDLPLIWAAAKLESSTLFELCLNCNPAMEAMRSFICPPSVMAKVQIGRLVILHEMGVDLSGRGVNGGGLAHEWGYVDVKPRAGWSTLVKRLPNVFSMKDNKGQTGADVMLLHLSATLKDKFLISMSNAERGAINAVIIKKSSNPLPPSRRRL